MNRVSVRNANTPMPTGQGGVGTKLLSPFEDGLYSSQRASNTGPIIAREHVCVFLGITSGFDVGVYAKSWFLGWLWEDV